MKNNGKKNKKNILTIVLILAVCIFASCKADQAVFDALDRYAYIDFELAETRDVTVEYTPADYSKLYWFYTAVKKDDYGKTGETGENILAPVVPLTNTNNYETLVVGLTTNKKGVGPFSLGEWSLKLVAYRDCTTSENSGDGYTYRLPYPVDSEKIDEKGAYIKKEAESGKSCYLSDENMVYESKEIKVDLIGSKLTTVSASVEPKGTEGTVTFENVEFESTVSFSSFKISRTDSGKATQNVQMTLAENNNTKEASNNGITVTWSDSDNSNTTYTVSGSSELEQGMYICELLYSEGNPATEKVGFSFPFAVYPNTNTKVTNEAIDSDSP